jgi:hypothetical protein
MQFAGDIPAGKRVELELLADWQRRTRLDPQPFQARIVVNRQGVFEAKPYCQPLQDSLTSALASAISTWRHPA